MITQLLDFTRIRLGRGIPLDRTAVDLEEVVSVVVEEIESTFGRPLKLETRGNTLGFWDRDRLAQMASNLVANACQHSTEGCVRIVLDGEGSEAVVFETRNEGSIPEAILPHIFAPLRQGAPSGHGASGLGLGLFITEQIALSHGGKISVESSPSCGTTFRVELPRGAQEQSERVFVDGR
jgi:signal transduction histidine kinase